MAGLNRRTGYATECRTRTRQAIQGRTGQDYDIVLELTQLNSIPLNWAGQDKTRQDKPLN